MQTESSNRSIVIWLYIIMFMVFCMVLIGGITRLTDSGLSMVDWRPIMGAIPPLTEAQWLETFEAYRQYPEYKLINKGMSLSDFKFIFFWEYFHRLFGRLIGIAFFFPFVYFTVKKKFSSSMFKKLCVAFVLGGMQGLMGWYMVKSGLVNKPDVSHLRLCAHLSLAFIIIGYIYWLTLELKFKASNNQLTKSFKPLFIFFIILCIQIMYGAFVAGLDAGLTYNTFPLMGRNFLPKDMFFMQPVLINLIENSGTIQFVHRTIGWILFAMGIYFFVKANQSENFQLKKGFKMLGVIVVLQFILGVSTLVMFVPISLASMHQIGACILLLVTIRCLFFSSKKIA